MATTKGINDYSEVEVAPLQCDVVSLQTNSVVDVVSPHVEFIPDVLLLDQQSMYTNIRDTVMESASDFMLHYVDDYVKMIEDLLFLARGFYKAKDFSDYCEASLIFLKLRCGQKSLLLSSCDFFTYLKSEIMSMKEFLSEDRPGLCPQSLDIHEQINNLHNLSDNLTELRSHKVYKSFKRIWGFLLTYALLEPIGLSFDRLKYSAMERQRIEVKSQKPDIIVDFIQSISFVILKGIEIYKYGTVGEMLHNGHSYSDFVKDYNTIRRQNSLLDISKVHEDDKVTESEFLMLLDKTIERGKSMEKFLKTQNNVNWKIVMSMTSDLVYIRSTRLTLVFAKSQKKDPYSTFIYGDTGIGKTTITNILKYVYCNVRNLPTGDEYFYSVSSFAKYFDGFTSAMHTVVHDDVANISPESWGKQDDPSVSSLMQEKNKHTFVPDQAALENKGKIPFRAEHIVLTSNVKHLNARAYFSYPSAVQRRFRYIITPSVRKEFATPDGMLDSSKTRGDTFPDYWYFNIEEAMTQDLNSGNSKFNAQYKLLYAGMSMKQLLNWYRNNIQEYWSNQSVVDQSNTVIKTYEPCPSCKLPSGMCLCYKQHAGGEDEEQESVPIMLLIKVFLILFVQNFIAIQVGWFIGQMITYVYFVLGWSVFYRIYHSTLLFISAGDYYFRNLALNIKRSLIVLWVTRDIRLVWFFYRNQARRTWYKVRFGLDYHWNEAYEEDIFYYYTRFKTYVGRLLYNNRFYSAYYKMTRSTTYWYKVGQETSYNIIRDKRMQAFAAICATLVGSSAIYILYKNMSKEMDKDIDEEEVKREISNETPEDVLRTLNTSKVVQHGATLSTCGTKPTEDNVSLHNPWKKEDYFLNVIDMGPLSLGWNSLSLENIILKLNNNFIVFNVQRGPTSIRYNRAFGLCGQYWLTNSHAFDDLDNYETIKLEIFNSPMSVGITSNKKLTISHHDIYSVNSDLVMIKLIGYPNCKDVRGLFAKPSFKASGETYYVGRNRFTGLIEKRQVFNVQYLPQFEYVRPELNKDQTFSAWSGVTTEAMVNGDCGSILIVNSSRGPVIVGIHYLGHAVTNFVVSLAVNTDMIAEALEAAKDVCQKDISDCALTIGNSTDRRDLQPLHWKSTVRWIDEDGTAYVYGSIKDFSSNLKSSVQATPFQSYLVSKYDFEVKFGAPDLKSWRPWNKGMKQLTNQAIGYKPNFVRLAVDSYFDRVVKMIDVEIIKNVIHVYDVYTAINGAPGVAFVDRQNMSSSAGFPYNSCKRKYLVEQPTVECPDGVVFVQEIMDEIDRMLEQYSKAQRCRVLFRFALKDEPRSFEKIESGDTRLFTIPPVAWTTVVRMYTLSFVRLIQLFPYVFGSAIGMVCQSPDWAEFYKVITKFGENQCLDGDYSKYDKMTPPEIMYGTQRFMLLLATLAGWSERDKTILTGIFVDIMFPNVIFNGDIMMLNGTLCSGVPITSIVNTLDGIIYMMIDFHEITGKSFNDYFEYVVQMQYGDDVILNVSPEISDVFNHTTISANKALHNVKFTMADKHSKSVPLKHISDCTFLKRSWRVDESTNMFCPLEEDSIKKMLTVWTRSKNITRDEQSLAILSAAHCEYFFYGEEIFYARQAMIMDLVDKYNLHYLIVPSTFPMYEVLLDRFLKSGRKRLEEDQIKSFNDVLTKRTLRSQALDVPLIFDETVVTPDITIEESCDLCMQSRDYEIGVCKIDGVSEHVVVLELNTISNNSAHTLVTALPKEISCLLISESGMYGEIWGDLESDRLFSLDVASSVNKDLTLRLHWPMGACMVYNRAAERVFKKITKGELSRDDLRLLYNVNHMVPQSEDTIAQGVSVTNTVSDADQVEETVTVKYFDENPGVNVEMSRIEDPSFNNDYLVDSDLHHFLNRPARIASINWNEAAQVAQSINPWQLYCNLPQVKRKLDNFAYMNGNLRIKVMINASPFLYGCCLMSYRPLTNFNSNQPEVFPANSQGLICKKSQRPHIWIYPQCNQAGEMLLPFFYYKNFINLTSSTDMGAMGTLEFDSIMPLMSANSTTTQNVTISVFASLENVKLCGPTIGLSMQSGDYTISKVASNIAKVADKVSYMSLIGPYAKATSVVANGISSIASIFGFTNDPVTDNVQAFKSLPFHSFASPEISEPIEKLTIDPKQELSIDSRIVGLNGNDELLISNLVQRDTVATWFNWTTAQAPNALLMKCNVSPYIVVSSTIDGYVRVAPTPMAHVSCLFGMWRGDIIYRFRFLCSKFHRGRVLIQWDPAPTGLIFGSMPDTNLVYSQVVDLAKETDVEFTVPFLQSTGWQNTEISQYLTSQLGNRNLVPENVSIPAYQASCMNGRLVMYVLTEQTSPVNSADITVLVSVRGSENLEFLNPVEPPINASLFNIQSEDVDMSGIDYEHTRSEMISNVPSKKDDNRYLINGGESIKSLRLLLRRTHYSRGNSCPPSTNKRFLLYRSLHAPLPLVPGYDPAGIHLAESKLTPGNFVPFNFVTQNPITWMMPCYLGYRGGVNWHYNSRSKALIDHTRSRRWCGTQAIGSYSEIADVGVNWSQSEYNRFNSLYISGGSAGQSLQNQKTQSGLSVYYPMYNRNRMLTTQLTSVSLGTSIDDSNVNRCSMEVIISPESDESVPSSTNVDFYVGVGTDFNFLFFINTPTYHVLSYESVTPQPA